MREVFGCSSDPRCAVGETHKNTRASISCYTNMLKGCTQTHKQKNTRLRYVCPLYVAVKWRPQSSGLLGEFALVINDLQNNACLQAETQRN